MSCIYDETPPSSQGIQCQFGTWSVSASLIAVDGARVYRILFWWKLHTEQQQLCAWTLYMAQVTEKILLMTIKNQKYQISKIRHLNILGLF